MKFLKEMIKELVLETSGEETVKLIDLLWEKENISEFTLAEDLKFHINYTRSLLYKLYAHNLVRSMRKKDKEKGWYIYYWTINLKHARDLIILRKTRKLAKLREFIARGKSTDFYVCPNECVHYNSERAMEHGFKCPECENVLVHQDRKHKVVETEEEIAKIESDLIELSKPLEIPKKKEEKPKKKPVSKKKTVKKKTTKKKGKKTKKTIKKKPKEKHKKNLKKKKPKTKKKKPIKKTTKKKPVLKKKKTKKLVKKKPKRKIIKKKPKKKIKPQKKSIKKSSSKKKKGFLRRIKF
ncbi:hypothetical protein K8R47_03545 [archaeon]|nr:hypothetical protein [archaeon]